MTYSDVFAGYEAKRDALRTWVQRHYIAEFELQRGTLLDAGCGNGFWASLFADAGFAVSGFDIRAELIAEARAKYPDIPFAVADAEGALQFVRKADVVFARTLPQFYQPTLEGGTALVANLLRKVKPGGLLLVSIFSDGSGEDRPMLLGGYARHHTDDALVWAIREAGMVRHVARKGNYLQVSVQ